MTATPARVAAANDAANRSLRTLVQGLLVDVLVAVGASLLALLTDVPSAWSWGLIGVALGKSALTAALSYYMRVRGQLPTLLAPVLSGEVVGPIVTVTAEAPTEVVYDDEPGEHAADR